MRREARAKTAAGRNWRCGGACDRIGARLENTTHLLWKSLGPTARKRSVVVDVNVGTPHHRHVAIHRVNQNKRLAILITSWLKIFVVLGGKLPLQKHHDGAAV
jgi:hypothetical protein